MLQAITDCAEEAAREAADLLMQKRREPIHASVKTDISNVVSQVDVASEQLVLQRIHAYFPGHSTIAEESGRELRETEYTWIIDPLDGTSNYLAGLPWFGVMLAVAHRGEIVVAVMNLPAMGLVYRASAHQGCTCNGEPVRVADRARLDEVLWAYGMDASQDRASVLNQARGLSELLPRVRNVRMTNSLVDAAYTAEGKFGGMLNHSTKLWDIAAPSLIVREAGGEYTTLDGRPLRFDVADSSLDLDRSYAVLAGAKHLHREVLAVLERP